MPVSPELFNQFIIGMIGIGLFQCFFGYRLFKIVLHLTGFCVACVFSVEYGRTLFNNEAAILIMGLLGGVLGAIIVILLFYVFVFLMGGYLGLILTHMISAYFLIVLNEWMLVVGALIFGALALFSQRFMLILATSYTGAWNVIAGINHFMMEGTRSPNYDRFFVYDDILLYIITACWAVLGTIGFYVQLKFTPKEISEKEKKAGVKVAPKKK